jgi:hypothetical protein
VEGRSVVDADYKEGVGILDDHIVGRKEYYMVAVGVDCKRVEGLEDHIADLGDKACTVAEMGQLEADMLGLEAGVPGIAGTLVVAVEETSYTVC